MPLFFLSAEARLRYALLVTFQSEMYFSMHEDRQLDSPGVMVEPGEGTQWSKQCSLTFC
jgi:hypothetical protein